MDEGSTALLRSTRIVFVVAAVAAFLAISPMASAAPGELDTTFNGSGKVLTDFGNSTAMSVAIQPDGKILVVSSLAGGGMRLARYDEDGSVDATFGTDGVVSSDEPGESIILEASGKILVGGTEIVPESDGETQYGVVLSRFLGNGAVDSSYGGGTGFASSDFGDSTDRPFGSEFGPDGTFYVVGIHGRGSGEGTDFAVSAYSPDGAPDMTFGDGSLVHTALSAHDDRAFAVAARPDGKVVVAGATAGGSVFGDFAIAEYKPDGSLETSFGDGGKAIEADHGFLLGVTLQPDGKIVAVGEGGGDIAVARYDEDGSLDADFGDGGITLTNPEAVIPGYSDAEALTAEVDSSGRIVVAGWAFSLYEPRDGFFIARYTPDGTLDRSFGEGGGTSAQFNWESGIRHLAIQSDGKIVAVGGTGGASSESLVFRYLGGDGATPNYYPLAVTVTGPGGVAAPGVWCQIICEPEYKEGRVVQLTPYPETGDEFVGWSGACTGSGTCEVTMDGPKAVTAEFAPEGTVHRMIKLWLTLIGKGSGEVDGCVNIPTLPGSICQREYPAGTHVTLNATAYEGSSFAGWSGDCTTNASSCEVVMDGEKHVTGEFVLSPTIETTSQSPENTPQGQPAPSVATPAPAEPAPKSSKPKTTCRKGFKKMTVKGKAKCVKVKHRHHKHT